MKIKTMGFSKLNNAEYSTFADRFIALVTAATTEALGAPEDEFAAYKEGAKLMTDIVAHSRISAQTAEMDAVEHDRDSVVVSVLDIIEAAYKSPLPGRHKAGTALFEQMKPYYGCHNWPNLQETAAIEGLITDLRKEKNASHVATLGLTDDINALEEFNNRYKSLTAERTAVKVTEKLEQSKKVRQTMNSHYDNITTLIFVQSVAKPAEVTARFIADLNAVIDETDALYNQRTAPRKPKE